LDTDVLVAAFRSERGASRELPVGALDEHFVLLACTALWLEYEAVPTRPLHLTAMGLSAAEGRDVIAALAVAAGAVTIHFLRRPVLADAEDEHVLDLAMNGRAEMLVTFNQDDFAEALAAAPAGAEFRGYQVILGEFVAVAAAALRQDSRPGAFRAEEREY